MHRPPIMRASLQIIVAFSAAASLTVANTEVNLPLYREDGKTFPKDVAIPTSNQPGLKLGAIYQSISAAKPTLLPGIIHHLDNGTYLVSTHPGWKASIPAMPVAVEDSLLNSKAVTEMWSDTTSWPALIASAFAGYPRINNLLAVDIPEGLRALTGRELHDVQKPNFQQFNDVIPDFEQGANCIAIVQTKSKKQKGGKLKINHPYALLERKGDNITLSDPAIGTRATTWSLDQVFREVDHVYRVFKENPEWGENP